jgi:hypothetical protein
VVLDDLPEIHPVKLIARENQHELMGKIPEMLKVAPHRVRRALIPVRALLGLLGGEDVHEAAAEGIEVESVLDVPVQRSRVELRQQENPVDVAVDAIADRNIDEAILSRQGHRRFAAFHRKGMQTRTASAAHDDCQDIFLRGHVER